MNRMPEIRRLFLLVLDSVGIGALPDVDQYGDEGANTLLHTALSRGSRGLTLPRLQALGLGNILPVPGVPAAPSPMESAGKMAEASRGKDTVAGHWEIAGIILDEPFALFPRGFPDSLIAAFQERAGCRAVLGNRAASGTAIIEELGARHLETGAPIVYTSADSVFQIAAHEEAIPLPRLYGLCETARTLCDPLRVGRVIARPFTGRPGAFARTAARRDYPMAPPGPTLLDRLRGQGIAVTGVGKIENIFAGRGLSRSIEAKNNEEAMARLVDEASRPGEGLVFANLIDFDMLYGHRRDAEGYARALEAFDQDLAGLLPHIAAKDALLVTADHGCDPTHAGTDHTREYVPLLVYSPAIAPRPLGVRGTFADAAATVLALFGLENAGPGQNVFSS